MCSFQNALRLYVAIFLALTLFAKAEEGTIESLEWQLPTGQAYFSVTIRVSTGKHVKQAQPFTGKVSVFGQTSQSFMMCAQRLNTDNFAYEASIAVPATFSDSDKTVNIYMLALSKAAGNLNIEQGYPCPEDYNDQYPFTSEQYIQSEKPFLITRKREDKVKEHHNPDFFPLIDSEKPQPWLGLSGSGYAVDGHNDFKRPPFIPPLDKTSFDLMLLPTLNLPVNWREYLPFASLYHWFTSTENEGITIIIRFDGQSPVTLRIRHEELPELAEHLLSARRLLHWLAPKLNGREQLIEQLLELSENAGLQPGFLSEELSQETQDAIQKQLAIVLALPDTEFDLEFETHLLTDSLSVLSPAISPQAGIIQLPIGKPGSQSISLEENSQPIQNEQPVHRPPGQGDGKDSGNNGEKSSPPGQPSGSPATGNSEAEISRDYFVIIVNDVRFHIQKEQLSPPQRGQEKASSVKVINPENPAENLSLDKVEVVTDVPEPFRLSKHDNPALDYLLTYGTRATKKALWSYYPVNLISERDGHLVADTNYQGFPVDAACEICQEPLLSQHSLTHCGHPGKHTFHTRCLSQWLGRDEPETRCPYCHDDLSEPLPTLLSKELESELHHAVETGNSNVLKALLETRVDVNARNGDGNTPLWVAGSHHQHDMIVLLLDNNADVHQAGFEGMTALDIAVLTTPRHPSSETTINLLLEKNVRLTETGVRGIDDLMNTRLQQALMVRFRQGAQQQTFYEQTENKAVQASKVQPLHCLICNAMEHVSTVNGLPVCNNCLKYQSEQTVIYELARKPEQKDPQIDSITDRVYLGNYDFASDREKLQRSGITSILVCGSSLTQHFPNDFHYLQLPVEDKTEQDISSYFSVAWDFIENELAKSPDNKVFVHCHAGVSRSSAIVISYLMRKLTMRYDEAFSFVKKRRPCVHPNDSFAVQLKLYEETLENKGIYGFPLGRSAAVVEKSASGIY